MNKKLWLAILMLVPLIAGCASAGGPAYTCSETVIVDVLDAYGHAVKTYTSPVLTSEVVRNEKEGMWYRVPQNPSEWEKFYTPINEGIQTMNRELRKLYVGDGFIHSPEQYELMLFSSLNGASDLSTDMCGSQEKHQAVWLQLSYCDGCENEYTTQSHLGTDTTYVKVTTPTGSEVSYSYPTAWLNVIVRHAFLGEPALELGGTFTKPDVKLGAEGYSETMLRALVSADQAGREVSSFTMNSNDFEGRNELKLVIARAMELAAAQESKPVVMSLKATTISGQHTVAQVSAHQDAMQIHGWAALTFGELHGSGGELDFQANYESRFETLTQGSIYLIVP